MRWVHEFHGTTLAATMAEAERTVAAARRVGALHAGTWTHRNGRGQSWYGAVEILGTEDQLVAAGISDWVLRDIKAGRRDPHKDPFSLTDLYFGSGGHERRDTSHDDQG